MIGSETFTSQALVQIGSLFSVPPAHHAFRRWHYTPLPVSFLLIFRADGTEAPFTNLHIAADRPQIAADTYDTRFIHLCLILIAISRVVVGRRLQAQV